MILTVFWTQRAAKKFDEIVEYLFQEWGEQTANNFIARVHNLIYSISLYPEIGSLEHEEKQIRGFLVSPQISMFYKVTDGKLIILNFFDTRQNPRKKRF